MSAEVTKKERSRRGLSRGLHQRREAEAPRGGPARVTLQFELEQVRAYRDRISALEAELRDQKKRQQEALDEYPVAYIQLMSNGIIREANAAATSLLGAGGGQVVLARFREFISPADVEPLYRHIHKCVTYAREDNGGGKDIRIETDVTIKKAEGWTPVRLISKPMTTARQSQNRIIPTAIVDMTEYREERHWLARDDQAFQHMLESIDGIVWEADHPFRLRFVSPQIERVLGYSPEAWMRTPSFWDERIHAADRERVLRERDVAVREGTHYTIEYRMHSARTGVVWLRESVIITRTPLGHKRLQGLVVNITALKQAEAEMRGAHQKLGVQVEEGRRHLAETVESMEAFCYGIAHELRAPVRAMRGFSDLLTRETVVAENQQASDYARRIAQASGYMDRLIEDLLGYGRLHHTDMTLVGVSMRTTVERVLQHLAAEIEQKKANVLVNTTSARVRAHPMLLSQALENLVSNALKFVPPGTSPQITIDADRTVRGRIRINVRDKGLGIDPAWQHKIFGVFQRAHSHEEFRGTGIGLAIVKRIVELMDGEVGVTSSPGQGSCFWIELPAAQESKD